MIVIAKQFPANCAGEASIQAGQAVGMDTIAKDGAGGANWWYIGSWPGCIELRVRRMAHTVFICHSSKDKKIADAACAALEAQNIRCWIAPRDILAGVEYGAAIIDALSDARIVLLIFSLRANESPQVRREIERAVSKEKIIVPFRIEDVMPSRAMEFALSNTHWLDAFTPPVESHLEELCATISRLLGTQTATGEAGARPAALKPGIKARRFSFKLLAWMALAAVAVVAAGYYVYSRTPQIRARQTIKDLRDQFPIARDALPVSGAGAFAKVDKDIDALLAFDPRNGHGLYYAGEVKRIKNPSLFTSKGCVIAQGLANSHESLDAYENDFMRYLDIERSLTPSEAGGDDFAETCYARLTGYCPQRTAWINHLLANDLYEEAALSTDPDIKAEQLRRALAFAQAAARLYQDGQNQGFSQCTPTMAIISAAKEKLKSLPQP